MSFNSARYFCWRAAICWSRISSGANTWARPAVTAKKILTRVLVTRIEDSLRAIGRISDGTNISGQRVDLSFRQAVCIWRHFRRFVQRGTAVADDSRQVRIADGVEDGAISEGMGLGSEIIVIGDALWSRFRVVTANAVN